MGLLTYIKEEMRILRERDPALHSNMEIMLYPGFKALLYYRIAHRLYLKKRFFLARWLSQRARKKTGIEIHPGAVIGKGCFIDHGHGIVIGETAVIGNNVTLYHDVTLGGTGKEKGKRHPTLQDHVMVGAGTRILGAVTIAQYAKIGAGSVVLRDIPEGCTAVGNPAHILPHKEIVSDAVEKEQDAGKVGMCDARQGALNCFKEKRVFGCMDHAPSGM